MNEDCSINSAVKYFVRLGFKICLFPFFIFMIVFSAGFTNTKDVRSDEFLYPLYQKSDSFNSLFNASRLPDLKSFVQDTIKKKGRYCYLPIQTNRCSELTVQTGDEIQKATDHFRNRFPLFRIDEIPVVIEFFRGIGKPVLIGVNDNF